MASSGTQILDSPEGGCIGAAAREKGKSVDPRERGSSLSPPLQQTESETQSRMQSVDVPETFGVHERRSSPKHPHRDDDNIHGRGTAIASAHLDSPLLRDLYLDLGFWTNGSTRALGRDDHKSLSFTMVLAELIADNPETIISQATSELSNASPSSLAASTFRPPRFVALDPEGPGDDVQGDHVSDDSSDDYDSMPDLISISDDRNRFRDWDWSADSDDAMSVPDLEPVTDDDFGFDIWDQRNLDESLLNSDEEEEVRVCWAEVDRARLPAASDSSSSGSEYEPEPKSDLSDDGRVEGNVTRSSTKMRRLTRPKRKTQRSRIGKSHTTASSSASPPSDSELPMRRVTSLDETAYATARTRLDDELDDRALARAWPIRTGDITSWWYQPIPLSDTLDRSFVRNLYPERASWRSYNPLLHQNELNWRPFLLSNLETREMDGDGVGSTVGESTVRAAAMGVADSR